MQFCSFSWSVGMITHYKEKDCPHFIPPVHKRVFLMRVFKSKKSIYFFISHSSTFVICPLSVFGEWIIEKLRDVFMGSPKLYTNNNLLNIAAAITTSYIVSNIVIKLL